MLFTSTPHPTTHHLKATPEELWRIEGTLRHLDDLERCGCRKCEEVTDRPEHCDSLALVPWRPPAEHEEDPMMMAFLSLRFFKAYVYLRLYVLIGSLRLIRFFNALSVY